MAQTAPRLSRVSNRFETWLDDASSSMFPQEKLRIEFPNHLMFFDWDFWDVFESSSSKDAFWDFFGHMWLGILWDVNQREAPRSCLWFVTSGRIIWICKRFIPLGWKSMSKLYVGLYIYRWLYIYIWYQWYMFVAMFVYNRVLYLTWCHFRCSFEQKGPGFPSAKLLSSCLQRIQRGHLKMEPKHGPTMVSENNLIQ